VRPKPASAMTTRAIFEKGESEKEGVSRTPFRNEGEDRRKHTYSEGHRVDVRHVHELSRKKFIPPFGFGHLVEDWTRSKDWISLDSSVA
jgi:hypothetical protein